MIFIPNLQCCLCLVVVWSWLPRVSTFPSEVPGLTARFLSSHAAPLFPCWPYLQSHHRVHHQVHEWEICYPTHHQLRGHIWTEYAYVSYRIYPQSRFRSRQWSHEACWENWIRKQQDQVPLNGSRSRKGNKKINKYWFKIDKYWFMKWIWKLCLIGVITCSTSNYHVEPNSLQDGKGVYRNLVTSRKQWINLLKLFSRVYKTTKDILVIF